MRINCKNEGSAARAGFLIWILILAGFVTGVAPATARVQQTAQQQAAAPVLAAPIVVDHGPNSAEQQAKHYVILVSLDGFRYGYARKYDAHNLQALGERGASAPDGMIPAYPSITFPNHYTIVTGLYPEHHGIVGNVFYDPTRKQVYSYRDPQAESDGTWYGGTPLWVLAEEQGMRAACFFWPGSEADIQGVRPSYYMKYDAKYPNEKRVEQVLAWLRLPAAQRRILLLYISAMWIARGTRTDRTARKWLERCTRWIRKSADWKPVSRD